MPKILDQSQIRQKKLEKLSQLGMDAYPARVKRTHTCEEVFFEYEKLTKEKGITLVGRLRSIRLHGGSCFAHIEDGTGKIQVYFKKDTLGEKEYQLLTGFTDIGDFLEVTGKLFTTKKGEKTLMIEKAKIISKSLTPLPEKWHGLSDIEIRYRQRYLDLIANPEVKAIFRKRSLIIKFIREFLDGEGFIEVDTPILQSLPGGALAKPFKTHHDALNTDLYLRIAPELYLKRLIIGGFERVYEIGRCFRNEGIDRDHNPEFTQVEFYVAYQDYQWMMEFVEKLIVYLLEKVNKYLMIEYQGNQIDFTAPYPHLTFRDAVKKYVKINIDEYQDRDSLAKKAKEIGLKIDKTFGRGKILDQIYKEWVRPEIINPTFITDYPIELSPLAKKKHDNQNYTERFQLLAGGIELTNAFSEINNPLDQKERFEAQEKLRKAGDEETQRIDYDFLEALEYGMPPTTGIGIGIDRLVALLTNSHNLKEVILFPTLKPKK